MPEPPEEDDSKEEKAEYQESARRVKRNRFCLFFLMVVLLLCLGFYVFSTLNEPRDEAIPIAKETRGRARGTKGR